MLRSWLLRLVVGLGIVLPLRAELKRVQGAELPNRIGSHVLVLSPSWAGRLPPTGAVNVPKGCGVLSPGQTLAVGLLGQGPAHEHLFDGVAANLRIKAADGTVTERRGLRPVAVRRVKGEGADMALVALKAAGIPEADLATAADTMAMMTVAVFATDWTVPAAAGGDCELSLEVAGTAEPVTTEPARLPVKTVAEWLKAPPLPEMEIGKQLRNYEATRSPGELLAWFNVVAKSRMLKSPPVHTFFAYAFNADPAVRAAVVEGYPLLDPATQSALLWVLRLGGANLRDLFPSESAETLAPFKELAPLPDARRLPRFHDPVNVQEAAEIGHAMDRCWSGWMATGDQTYLRALVDLLDGADDFATFVAWTKARGGAKGLDARVVRGMAYQIAGWSIGSFQRTDPLVADWLAYWQTDPTVSVIIRRELGTLLTNPAFKRK